MEPVALEEPGRGRRIVGRVLTALAVVLVLGALLVPDQLSRFSVLAFLRLPVEAIAGVGLALLLPPRPRRIVAAVFGAGLGLVLIVKLADIGFFIAFDRPFNLVFDWSFLPPAVGLVEDSAGKVAAIAAAVGVCLLVVALLVLTALAAMRLARITAGHRKTAGGTAAVLGVVWIVCAVTALQFEAGEPVAARTAASLVYHDGRQVLADLHDHTAFEQELATDAYRNTPPQGLLTGLRGKNVLLTFVESYGRVAVQDSDIAPGVDALLDNGTNSLRAAGFDARSGFLTSSTTGGGSWLAHSTLESGTWVNNQQRYNTLVGSDRLTLAKAFGNAGWRTVADEPANMADWPEGAFYGYRQVYDARNVGYHGPSFSYATMPDQFTMKMFHDNELAKPGHPPVMSEIVLVSSHWPWAPLPRMVGWDQVGDGSVYQPMPAQGRQLPEAWSSPANTRAAYGDSIQYSLSTLISYLQTYGDENTVLVFLGDHQPNTAVTGSEGASRDVPITIVAKDPKVLDRISSWGWTPGLRPDPKAPVWPMDAFRDRFLSAFSQ
ncbi:sulfatase-like hydrolase/transferase [Amycolatopsis pithecellobii]|uniref:Sulfatase-like hydrolase/transferase n=1 Tax=Amycolatopsis pithecellobii TaxID=664692 RepID=A0A6N7YYE0_9PSEU|nr:sulfatase-like hydrolase/transferase [Amycolatopsis pithecellobii]